MAPQLPPTLRGVRVRGTKPREVVAFQGCCVWGFARVGAAAVVSDDPAAASAAALARATAAFVSSFSRQQCLYLRPEPQWHGWLRPGGALVGAVIERVYRLMRAAVHPDARVILFVRVDVDHPTE
jgi:hypothetical protein